MNNFLAAAASRVVSRWDDGTTQVGALVKSGVTLIADHQWRTTFPYLVQGSRATVVGQGSTVHVVSTVAAGCDFPDGSDTPLITPIDTPLLYDSYGIAVEGGPLGADMQQIDLTPGNHASFGRIGDGNRRLPFVSEVVPGDGTIIDKYGNFDYAPQASAAQPDPPTYRAPGTRDKVVNRERSRLNLGLGLKFGDTPTNPTPTNPKGTKPAQVDLATVGGVNVSGLLETGGDDAKGVIANVDGVTVVIDPTTRKLTAPAGASMAIRVKAAGGFAIPPSDPGTSGIPWDSAIYDTTGTSMWASGTPDQLIAPVHGIYAMSGVVGCGFFPSVLGGGATTPITIYLRFGTTVFPYDFTEMQWIFASEIVNNVAVFDASHYHEFELAAGQVVWLTCFCAASGVNPMVTTDAHATLSLVAPLT